MDWSCITKVESVCCAIHTESLCKKEMFHPERVKADHLLVEDLMHTFTNFVLAPYGVQPWCPVGCIVHARGRNGIVS